MKSNQKLSILFWPFKAKATKDGKAPIYVWITINGIDNEISIGRKVHPNDWCNQNKKVTASGMEAKLINIAIDQARTSLTSQFMMLQSQFECITGDCGKTDHKISFCAHHPFWSRPTSKLSKYQQVMTNERFCLIAQSATESDGHWHRISHFNGHHCHPLSIQTDERVGGQLFP